MADLIIKNKPAQVKTVDTSVDPTVRPVKLMTKKYKLRNGQRGVTYNEVSPVELQDLNAADAAFEREQISAGVLIIVEG